MPRRDPAGFELYYPGAGHAPDNLVVYFSGERVLFGGCLVKSDTATTVGNVADADVAEWPRSVARVAARYPKAIVVVPGHGAVSGFTALAVTEKLITDKGPVAAEALRRQQNKSR
jgi:metallo-beta-lactamase class B